MYKRMIALLNNRRADDAEVESEVPRYITTLWIIVIAICIVIYLSYSSMEIAVRHNVGLHLDTAVDSVETTGVINQGVQKYLQEKFDGMISYSGNYEIRYVTYNISNLASKTTLGVSTNGAYIGNLTVPKGNIVSIQFVATETTTDKMFHNVFKQKIVGMVEVKEGKVN